nr:aquaporin TIP3-1-like [Quercus suber]
MDNVLTNKAAGSQLPRSLEKYEADNYSYKTKFLAFIGAHEFYSPEGSLMWKAAFTELVATALIVFTLTTTIISCLDSHAGEPKLLVPLAVFIIAFLFLVVTIPLSGGHMNPMITFIAAIMGAVTTVRAIAYFVGQLGGSIFAYFLLKTVMSDEIVDKYLVGGCPINRDGTGISLGTALLIEFMCCFIVLMTSMTVIFDKKRFQEVGLAGVCALIAGSISVAIFVSVMITGQPGYAAAGLNPARCLGPALVLGKHDLWHGQWVFWVGPFLACIAYYAYAKTLPAVESVY